MTDRSSTPHGDEKNPGGQHRFTRVEYDKLTPHQQGMVSYMQGAWNASVPEKCPFPRKSKQAREWADGQQCAVILVQDDGDEE